MKIPSSFHIPMDERIARSRCTALVFRKKMSGLQSSPNQKSRSRNDTATRIKRVIRWSPSKNKTKWRIRYCRSPSVRARPKRPHSRPEKYARRHSKDTVTPVALTHTHTHTHTNETKNNPSRAAKDTPRYCEAEIHTAPRPFEAAGRSRGPDKTR